MEGEFRERPANIQTHATSPQGKLEKWHAITKTLHVAIGIVSPKQKSGFKWTNTRVYSVVEEQQKQAVEIPPPQRYGRMDRGLIVLTLCLIAVGILMVYSASHLLSSRHYDGYSYHYLQIHIIACAIGLVGMFLYIASTLQVLCKVRKPFFNTRLHRTIIGFCPRFRCKCTRRRRR